MPSGTLRAYRKTATRTVPSAPLILQRVRPTMVGSCCIQPASAWPVQGYLGASAPHLHWRLTGALQLQLLTSAAAVQTQSGCALLQSRNTPDHQPDDTPFPMTQPDGMSTGMQ